MSEDVSSDVIKKTQKSLGKYVKKPPLTEKLLRKPPFRFLQDIIITVLRETNYLKGLFTEDELSSDKVKEKEAKIAFLNKLIDAVKNTVKIDLPVRASKIVAGLETTNTNLLLQAIATALESNIDSSSYVNKIKSENGASEEKKIKKTTTLTTNKEGQKERIQMKIVKEDVHKTPKDKKVSEKIRKDKNTGEKTPKSKKSNTSLDSSRNKDSKARVLDKRQVPDRKEKNILNEKISPKSDRIKSIKNVDTSMKKSNVESDEVMQNNSGAVEVLSSIEKDPPDEKSQEQNMMSIKVESVVDKDLIEQVDPVDKNQTEADITISTNEEHSTRNTVVRPKSARPKSGEKRVLSAARLDSVIPTNNAEPSNISASKHHSNPTYRPKSSLRPPSVRPSSARPGAPRLRPDSALPMHETVTMGNINVIVENVDLADDEETVVIETVSETSKDPVSPLEVSSDNKGQLVEQILEQIAEDSEGKRKTEIDWENEAARSKDGTHKDVLNLRDLIQKLTKTANPLGKLINYLHEDIDAMHIELQIWSNTKRQLSDEIIKQKKISIEANKPLIAHLDQIQQEIKKQQQELTMIHSNILRNDTRIKELLRK